MKKLILLLTLITSFNSIAQIADFMASSTTICSGGNITFTNLSSGATSYAWTFIDGASSQTSTLTNPVITYSTAGSFAVILTASNSTTSDTEIKTGYITVLPAATITLTSGVGSNIQSVCSNSPFAITYNITGATGANVTFSPVSAGATSSFVSSPSGGTLTISGTPTSSFTYSVTTTGGSCAPLNASGSVSITPAPTLSLSSAASTAAQTVCLNTNIATINYSFGGSATGVTITGLPTNVFYATTSLSASVSGTPSTVGTYNFLVVTTGGTCPPDSLTGQIIVDTSHVLTLQSAAATTSQTVCVNDSITDISYVIGGSATGATVIGLPTGINGSFLNGVLTISGSSSASGIHSYTVSTTGVGCPSVTLTGSITIDALPVLTLTSAAVTDTQTVCLNTSIATITYTFGGSATNVTITGLPSNVFYATSSSSASISGSPSTVGSANFMVVSTGGVCSPDTLVGQINVDTLSTITLASAIGSEHQTICANANLSPLNFVIGGSATSATISGFPAGITSMMSSDTLLISGSVATAGIYPYNVTTAGGACPSSTFSDTLFVQIAPTISLASGPLSDSQTVCTNIAISPINYSYGGAATGITVIGLPNGVTTSTTGNTLTISGTPIQAGTFNFLAITVGGVCNPDTLTGTINVESPFITLVSPAYTNNQLICMNSPIDTIQYLISGVVSTYDLPIGASTSITAGAPDTLSIFGLPTTAGSYFYTIQYNGLCGNALVVGSLTILDTIVNNQIGNDTTVCHGTSFQFTGTNFTNSGITAYNYSWENAPSATGPWTAAPGINNLSGYSNNAVLSVTLPFFRRIVTNGSCLDSSNVVQLTIDTIPAASNTNSNYTVCINDTVNVSGLTISNATPNGWSTTGSGVLQNLSGITPQYIPSLADAGTTVLLTYEVISNNACSPLSLTGTIGIVVAPIPVALAGSSATACANGTEINIPGTQAINGVISWTTTGNGTLSDSTVLSPTYTTNLADTGDTLLFTMIVSDTSCTNPLSDTAQFQLFVDPIGINPVINAFAGPDVTIGLGDSIQLAASGVAITSWNWSPGFELSDSTIFDPFASPIDTTVYMLTVFDINGCIDTDTLIVNVVPVTDFFIPNLFSPNGDGSNDFWEIPKLPYYPNTLVTIINREGMEVYRNANYDNTWDGKYDGKELPEATYYYYVKLATNDKVYKGAVTILRNK
jgi:gliding motility-associated-like protein